MSQQAKDKINNLRKKIDVMDAGLVDLLNKRAELAYDVKKLKLANNMPILDSERETRIHEMIRRKSKGLLKEEDLERIYKLLLEVMRGIDEA
ncbi:hypothetical protein LCGC14_0981870 [marine sediment metagenome]|uniref:Chorismate mutase domain-containing protein n=1 Tax=marine sediment metagenome TaxID=412755 RepID=A0A0F9N8J9_9ZZZZ|nr:hypothetical protein [Actinomycetota bacterium]